MILPLINIYVSWIEFPYQPIRFNESNVRPIMRIMLVIIVLFISHVEVYESTYTGSVNDITFMSIWEWLNKSYVHNMGAKILIRQLMQFKSLPVWLNNPSLLDGLNVCQCKCSVELLCLIPSEISSSHYVSMVIFTVDASLNVYRCW